MSGPRRFAPAGSDAKLPRSVSKPCCPISKTACLGVRVALLRAMRPPSSPHLFASRLVLLGSLMACGDEGLPGDDGPGNGGELAWFEGTAESADGTSIAYFALGPAHAEQTLIAINGGPGDTHHTIAHVLELATENRRVVLYDQRGLGASGSAPSSRLDLDHQVADIDALRDELDASRPVLLAQSWGGLIAQAYAAARPEGLDRLVLVASMAGAREVDVAYYGCWQPRVADLQARGFIPTPLPEGWCASADAAGPAYFHDPEFSPPATDNECNDAVGAATWAAVGDFDFRDQLASLQAPVLILVGESDCSRVYFDAHVEMFDADRVEAHVVPEAGHLLLVEQPATGFAIIRAFLED